MHYCAAHRVPRAGVDRFTGAADALAVISLAVQRPLVHETVVVVLDHQRRGRTLTVVSGTRRPDDVIEVVECLAGVAANAGEAGALVVASVRPGGGIEAADVDRWLECSDLADGFGIELVEWFVVSGTVECPRDLFGEAPRW